MFKRWGVVMSRGKRLILSCLDSFSGYGGRVDLPVGMGGIVEAGVGDVKANRRAVATASANVLNSATGVTLPGTSTAPPMTAISLTLRKVSGSSDAANAKFVSGPNAHIEIESAGSSFKILRISLCAGVLEGVKYW